MLNNNNRVLTRMGARELTQKETGKISGSGGDLLTLLSVYITGTGPNYDEMRDQ